MGRRQPAGEATIKSQIDGQSLTLRLRQSRGVAPSPEEFLALRQEVAELKGLLSGIAAPNGQHSMSRS